MLNSFLIDFSFIKQFGCIAENYHNKESNDALEKEFIIGQEGSDMMADRSKIRGFGIRGD